ncbi:MAG: hypothetical protein ILP10_07070, partial [Lachnospiraceae bacterium]|nr:hypothetical protein [Lachnospiraceae bacterium]
KTVEEKDRKLKQAEKSLEENGLKLKQAEKSLEENGLKLKQAEKTIEEKDLKIKNAEQARSEDTAKTESSDRLARLETERADRLLKEKEELENRNLELEQNLKLLEQSRNYRLADVIDPGFEFNKRLSESNPSLYKHCEQIANCAAKACDLIGADSMLGYAIGLYHEAGKALGTDDVERELEKLHLPENVIAGAIAVKKTPDKPILRETGIVILSDEIRNTVMYARSKNLNVTADKIVSNVMKAKKEQGLLRLAGLSVEEMQLIRMLFSEMFA